MKLTYLISRTYTPKCARVWNNKSIAPNKKKKYWSKIQRLNDYNVYAYC